MIPVKLIKLESEEMDDANLNGMIHAGRHAIQTQISLRETEIGRIN